MRNAPDLLDKSGAFLIKDRLLSSSLSIIQKVTKGVL